LTKVDNGKYLPYLDYIMTFINNKGDEIIYILDDKKSNKLKSKILYYKKSNSVFRYKLDILRNNLKNAVIESVSKKEYLKRIRKQKIKQINESKRFS